MPLTHGQSVQTRYLGTLTVQEKLGEGGQGAVYLVENEDKQYALKWYAPQQATEEQRLAILALVKSGPPRGLAGKRFIWPLDIATLENSAQFGYVMPLIDTERFAELDEVRAGFKVRPNFQTLCEISYQMANSYRALHLSGYCYRDIARGNLMFDPQTGDVRICDNDNVGIDRQSAGQVVGTMEYMAPELVRGEAKPSIETDLHSLAVLLFQLWMWHHPMHGALEYNIRSWDLHAKRLIYGRNALFIFHPKDTSNHLPEETGYTHVKRHWGICPQSLRDLFTHAFTIGLYDPRRRVTEGQWQRLFLQLQDGLIHCSCQAENFWQPDQKRVRCWHCRRSLPIPPALRFNYPGGQHDLLLKPGVHILKRHLNPMIDEIDGKEEIAQIVQHPQNPSLWGLQNLTSHTWTVTYPTQTILVPPRRRASLAKGLKIQFGETRIEL